MKAILKDKSTRKNFLIIIGLILAIIIISRIFVIPTFSNDPEPEFISYIKLILDNLFIALVVSVFLGLFTFYIEIPESEKKHSIVDSNTLKEYFPKARLDTDFWYFSGGTGRYTRAVTIPEISQISEKLNSHKNIRINLLDPTDVILCKAYAKFRTSLKSGKKEKKWNLEYVRREIIATICCAVIYRSKNQLLEISIFLKNSFSSLRIDLSKNYCFVTKEDKQEPALLIPKDTFLYRTFREEILQTSKQYKQIDMTGNMDNIEIGKIQSGDIEEMTFHFGFNAFLGQRDFEAIADIINKNENPYG